MAYYIKVNFLEGKMGRVKFAYETDVVVELSRLEKIANVKLSDQCSNKSY